LILIVRGNLGGSQKTQKEDKQNKTQKTSRTLQCNQQQQILAKGQYHNNINYSSYKCQTPKTQTGQPHGNH
jgi:hypothetical protein